MLIIWSACSGCGTCTVGAMALVIVRENFSTIGQRWIVDWVIECDDFRVISRIIIIQIIKTCVSTINAGINDGNRRTCTIVTSISPNGVYTVHNSSIAVCCSQNSIEFKHDDAGQGRRVKDTIHGYTTGKCVDSLKCPLMLEFNFSF